MAGGMRYRNDQLERAADELELEPGRFGVTGEPHRVVGGTAWRAIHGRNLRSEQLTRAAPRPGRPAVTSQRLPRTPKPPQLPPMDHRVRDQTSFCDIV